MLNFYNFLAEILVVIIINKFKIMRQQQVILQFRGSTHGYLKESGKIGFTLSAPTFGNISRNGDTGTPQLAD